MIKGTVALPVWNSEKIAWLAMESLCRQHKPKEAWELIIYEELHHNQIGQEFFISYTDRLRSKGCERMEYLTSFNKVPLSQKWVLISRAASASSKYFCLCAADNYYHPWMLKDFEEAIKESDWCLTANGYFYDFNVKSVIRYHHKGLVGLQMAANTQRVQMFPMEEVNRGVDGWFSRKMLDSVHSEDKLLKGWIDGSNHWQHTLCTNGFNNISKGRITYFKKPEPPFYETDVKLWEIVPCDIYKRLKCLSQ